MTTRELRRYTLKPEMAEEFLAWFFAGVPALRARYGFTVETCIIDRERLQFDWIVSHPGDEAAFAEAAQRQQHAPEWIDYLSRIQPSIDVLERSFVEVVVPGLPD